MERSIVIIACKIGSEKKKKTTKRESRSLSKKYNIFTKKYYNEIVMKEKNNILDTEIRIKKQKKEEIKNEAIVIEGGYGDIVSLLQTRTIKVIDIKGKPTEVPVPPIIEEIIVEINYAESFNEEESLTSELDLENWIKSKDDRTLSYAYKIYLIAWKMLTNDIAVFAPINSKQNVVIKPTLVFDKEIPSDLAKLIEYEKVEYEE